MSEIDWNGKKLYIVFGTTGEYSDHREWSVVAYLTREAAEEHVKNCDKWLLEHDVHRNSARENRYESLPDLENPWDPNFSCDYTGTSYYVVECPAAFDGADGHAVVLSQGPRAILLRE